MTVIDLQQVKADREAPDADCTERDQYGRPMQCYGIEYDFDGALETFSIMAYSLEDAERRARAIRDGATVYGQIYRAGTY